MLIEIIKSRQALCETPVYYRAYQSGAYVSGGLVHGFLLNHDATERAYMDAEVVVARAYVPLCSRINVTEMNLAEVIAR